MFYSHLISEDYLISDSKKFAKTESLKKLRMFIANELTCQPWGKFKLTPISVNGGADFLPFMDQLEAAHPGKEIHVILDNFSSHKIEKDPWLLKHPQVHLHFTPTHASWLNQIEIWFGILTWQALRGANFVSVKHLIETIEKFIQVYNPTAFPFEWTKVNVTSKTICSP